MNPITNKFFLAGDRFMLEMHSRQSGFSYSACGLYTKNKEKIRKFKEVGDQINLSEWTRQDLFSTWFDLWCIINLLRRTASNKVLCDKSFEIAGNSKYDGHQRGLPSKVFEKNLEILLLTQEQHNLRCSFWESTIGQWITENAFEGRIT